MNFKEELRKKAEMTPREFKEQFNWVTDNGAERLLRSIQDVEAGRTFEKELIEPTDD